MEYAVLLLGGIAVGIFGSTTGGASLVTIPLLLWVGLPTLVALGTNKVSIVFLEVTSSIRFYSSGQRKIRWKKAFLYGVLAAVGSVTGAQFSVSINESTLDIVLIVVLATALVVLNSKKQLGLDKPKQHRPSKAQDYAIMAGTVLLGIYGGMIGGGFGTFMTFLLVFAGNSFLDSVAAARLIGIFMSGSAAISFMLAGAIQYNYAVTLGIGLAIGAWFGARMSENRGSQFVRYLFIGFVVISLLKLLFDVLQ